MDLEFKKKLGDADWSATQTIMAGVGYPTGLFAFGNYLFSLGWDDANKDVNDLSAIKMVVSEDDGASWSSPKTVVEEVEMQSAGLTFHLPPPLPSPTFSPGECIFEESITVSMSCLLGDIHYTTDGSTPDENSTLYSSALTFTTTTTLKAIAVKDDTEEFYSPSSVMTATYTLKE